MNHLAAMFELDARVNERGDLDVAVLVGHQRHDAQRDNQWHPEKGCPTNRDNERHP